LTKVVVNGTFDILHLGHIRLLELARSYPNSYVYVLIDSDRRVKELKGSDRPVHNEYERASFLFALKAVDRVDIFDSDQELIDYIKNYQPDVMVKGSDYQGKPIIGQEHCKQIKFYDRFKNYSTTNTIQNIINRR
jgi:D-beta-D-heptose 7-phosphate kinase/D-beta-D-heptose 1-phosphate adenosyltransferase